MQRKSFAVLGKESLIYYPLILPFLLIGLAFNSFDLLKLLVEFVRFSAVGPGAVTPLPFHFADISTLLIITIFATLFYGTLDDIIAMAIGFPKRIEELKRLHKYPFFVTLLFFTLTIALEELIFRGFFLLVLPRWIKGDVALYILLFISNSIFAYMHIDNYKGSSRAMKFFPHFLMSLVFAYVFLKFGLVACFIVHFLNNLLSTAQDRLYGLCFGEHP